MSLSLVVGPANAGKVALLLDRYLSRLDDEPYLIVPNRSDIDRVERELLVRCGCLFSGSIGTFDVQVAKIAITKYGLTRNPRTNQWSGTIKLTNTGNATISGPIFVLFNLPAGAILENAAGTYNGMPYLEVNIPSLAVGVTTSATVVYNSNVSASINTTSYYLVSLGS